MPPDPDRRSAYQRIIAAEADAARARMSMGNPASFDPDEVTSEVFRLMPPRPKTQPTTKPKQSKITALRQASRPVRRWLAVVLTGVLIAVLAAWLAGYLPHH
jgi:hypothetical protein